MHSTIKLIRKQPECFEVWKIDFEKGSDVGKQISTASKTEIKQKTQFP